MSSWDVVRAGLIGASAVALCACSSKSGTNGASGGSSNDADAAADSGVDSSAGGGGILNGAGGMAASAGMTSSGGASEAGAAGVANGGRSTGGTGGVIGGGTGGITSGGTGGLLTAGAGGVSTGGSGGTATGGTGGTVTGGTGGVATGGAGGADTGGTAGTGGTAITCTSGTDCPSSAHLCDPLRRQCIACSYDSDCAAGEHCSRNACEPTVYCRRSQDCAGHPATPACDLRYYRCAECGYDANCAQPARCVDGHCQPYEACVNSLDCPAGNVCDRANGTCRRCVANADCGAGMVCANYECATACASDLQCVGAGLLCNGTNCTQCVQNADCPAQYYCSSGKCVTDFCEPNTTFCYDPYAGSINTNVDVYSCNAAGSGATRSTDCSYAQTCVHQGTSTTCVAQTCQPSSVFCSNGTTLATCSADGLSTASTSQCPSGQQCVSGACRTIICDSRRITCSSDRHQTLACNSYGDAQSVYEDCWSRSEYCDSTKIACLPRVCPPGGAACSGTWRATCNDLGDAVASTVADCATQSQVCLAGQCVSHAVDYVAALNPTSGPTYYSSYTLGNLYVADSTRKLTEFGQRLSATSFTTFEWYVYENTGSSFVSVFNKSDRYTIVDAQGYYSTGAISVPLTAGREYEIGIRFATNYSYTLYQRDEGSREVSFGRVIGSEIDGGLVYGPYPDRTTGIHYTQRLTTDPP